MKLIKKKDKDSPADLLFVGCFLIGMGLGFYFNNLLVGLFLGLGVGFIAMFIAELLLKKNK